MDKCAKMWHFSSAVAKLNKNQNSDTQVIVIEDDVDVQDLLQAYFSPRGYSLTFFDNPMNLLAEARKTNLTADAIITDLVLPEISGMELIKKLRGWGIHLPIILMTSRSSVQTAFEATQAGAFDFIVKPLQLPQLEVSLQRALKFKQILHENTTLRQALKERSDSQIEGIIAKSPGFRAALELAKRVSTSSANILITGESGTGKEVIAKAIHEWGNRKNGPFLAINCAAIPEALLEAELFGHTKGSFTGAIDKKEGLFEEAQGGILLLDEIGDMGLPLQAKILRVLQERKIKRIGENKYRDVDVRVIAATHKNLKNEVMEKRFREDLFFRLNVIPIHIPPLRNRKEDIIPLAEHFLSRFAILNSVHAKKFSKETLSYLLTHTWPGNVRELENTIERAVVLSERDEIKVSDLLLEEYSSASRVNYNSEEPVAAAVEIEEISGTDEESVKLEKIVKRHILKILDLNKGAKDKTAKMLGIDRKTLYRKLNDYGLTH